MPSCSFSYNKRPGKKSRAVQRVWEKLINEGEIMYCWCIMSWWGRRQDKEQGRLLAILLDLNYTEQPCIKRINQGEKTPEKQVRIANQCSVDPVLNTMFIWQNTYTHNMRAEEKPRTRPDYGAEFTERQKVSRASDHVTTHTHLHPVPSTPLTAKHSSHLHSFTEKTLNCRKTLFFSSFFLTTKLLVKKKKEKKLFSTDTWGDAAPRWTVVTQNKEYVEQVWEYTHTHTVLQM